MANSLFTDKKAGPGREERKALTGFTMMDERSYADCIGKLKLSMDEADLALCVEYFRDTEQRDPSATELRVIDSCWSEDVRHGILNTVIDSVTCPDALLEKAYMDYLRARKAIERDRPVTLKDIGEMASRYIRSGGMPERPEDADAGSRFAMDIDAEVDGEKEPWVLSVNRDGETLSGRAYTFSAMRLMAEGRPEAGELRGEDSMVCTAMADRIYHPGYMGVPLNADISFAAAPVVNFRDEEPEAGDAVILLGGRGFGSSGEEEHRVQSFLRSAMVSRVIKRCAVIGEKGICAAVFGLADGLEIDIDPLLESEGGMLCVLSAGSEKMFSDRASDEDIGCLRVATVTDAGRLVIQSGGEILADLSTEFLAAMGAVKHADIETAPAGEWQRTAKYDGDGSFITAMKAMAQDVNLCSRRGLAERYDATAGAGTVLMPNGGRNQLTPAQAMACRLPLERGTTEDCIMAAWGFNPYIAEASPYHAGYLAVVEAATKLVASGASPEDIFLTMQGRFASPDKDPSGLAGPLGSMLGAFEAQIGLGIGSLGTNEKWIEGAYSEGMPPTLIATASSMTGMRETATPEFKEAGHEVVIIRPFADEYGNGVGLGLPEPASILRVWHKVYEMLHSGEAVAAYAVGAGGIGEAVMKMCFGNGLGFRFEPEVFRDYEGNERSNYASSARKAAAMKDIFRYSYGSIILELEEDADLKGRSISIERLGRITDDQKITLEDESLEIGELLIQYEGRLENVWPTKAAGLAGTAPNIKYSARSWHAPIFKRSEPRVLIPVFAGTGCAAEAARAVREAGGVPGIMIIKDSLPGDGERSALQFANALRDAQMIFVPEGSVTDFFRHKAIEEGITNLLEKHDGLICGTGGGFRTLLELGLVPYGRYAKEGEELAVLEENPVGSRGSCIVRLRISSNKSPWLRDYGAGEVRLLPFSCAAGRFNASEELMSHLAGAGQIATQFADLEGNASGDIQFDPCGSMMAAEGVTSLDGRVFGRTGYAERTGRGLYRNVEGRYFGNMFDSAVRYFK